MAYGVKSLRKIQFGRETTAGTIAAATTIWRGEGVIEDTRTVEFPNEDVGLLPGTTRSYQPAMGAKISLVSTPATFEQLPHILEMAIKAGAVVADGVGSGKIWTFTLPSAAASAPFVTPTSSANAFKTYTIEGGDNNEAEVAEFCFVTDFELSWKAGEAVMISATIEGRQVALQAFSGGATIPAVFEMLASKGKFYVDAIGGTIGTTQITNEILAGSVKVKTGLQAVRTSDGSLAFSFVKGVKSELVMEVTFEHSTFAKAEKVFWRAGTPRLFQFKVEGNALTTSSSYVYKTMKVNVAGTYSKFSALEDQDGDDTITATIHGAYDATAAQYAQIIVVNELAAIP